MIFVRGVGNLPTRVLASHYGALNMKSTRNGPDPAEGSGENRQKVPGLGNLCLY